MEKNYIIGNNVLTLMCDDEEVYQRINKWLAIFKNVDKSQSINLLTINKSIMRLVLFNEEILNVKLESTDLYPIIMNVISNLIDDEDNLVLHSSVISNNKSGILILGTFGAGKTNLALISEKHGYKINSADFSWLTIKNRKLYLEKGSCYLKYESKERNLSNDDCQSEIKIDKIIYLIGACDGGKLKVDRILNYKHIVKRIFPFANWHSSMPLIGSDLELPINNLYIKTFLSKLSKLDIDFLLVRGDSNDLISMINGKMVI